MTDLEGTSSSQRPEGEQIRCPNCGHENEQGDRFCANCGMPLPEAPAIPPQYSQPESRLAESAESAESDDWRMSSLGPPPARKRRVWLWVLIGILAVCLVACVGLVIFASTEAGGDWIAEQSTRISEQATETAR